MFSFLIMVLFLSVAYFIIFSLIWLVLARIGSNISVRSAINLQEEANNFLSKWLSQKDLIAINPLTTSSVFERAYHWCIVFMYERKFHRYPPLLQSLFTLEKDKPFDTINLLYSLRPIFLWALRKEGVPINPHLKEEHALISCGFKEDNNSFLSKKNFYSKLDDYIEKDTVNIAWSTGEFGMLEDQKFLDALEACKRSTASIMGYIEGILFKIDEFLDKFFEITAKEGKSLDKKTESKRRTQIKRLVENKKISLFIAPHRLNGPHMAVIGESVYIQQRHVYDKSPEKAPVAVIFVRHPSENLTLFINDYLQELRESLRFTEVK